MKKRSSIKELRAVARRAFDVGINARLDGLDGARAVMAAAIGLARAARMSHGDIADWLRRLADEQDELAEAHAAKVRELLRSQPPTKGA